MPLEQLQVQERGLMQEEGSLQGWRTVGRMGVWWKGLGLNHLAEGEWILEMRVQEVRMQGQMVR